MSPQMTQALAQLVGKTIAHVVVKAGQSPQSQLFLIFTDGTYYEWYAETPITGTSTLSEGGVSAVQRYMADHTIVCEV